MSNFMDTFFFLSLGITFALILLLVYHFKQRLSNTEQKCDTMFEIINGMASELNSMKGFLTSRPISNPMANIQDTGIPLNSLFSQMPQPSENNMMAIHEESDEDHDSEFDDSDDESVDDSDDESIPFESIDEGDENQSKIVVSDTDESEHQLPKNTDNIVQIAENFTSSVEVPGDSINNFHKMTLANLKSYAIEKGLVETTSKMRKSDLIDLLESK